MNITHRPIREGLIAGLVGAAVTVLWLLVVDAIAGDALLTIERLGSGIIEVVRVLNAEVRGNQPVMAAPSALAQLVAFTMLHVVVWGAFGIAFVAIVHRAAKMPTILLAAALVFILLQLGMVALTGLLVQLGLGPGGWIRILGGNALGTAAIWLIVATRHPVIEELKHASDEEA